MILFRPQISVLHAYYDELQTQVVLTCFKNERVETVVIVGDIIFGTKLSKRGSWPDLLV